MGVRVAHGQEHIPHRHLAALLRRAARQHADHFHARLLPRGLPGQEKADPACLAVAAGIDACGGAGGTEGPVLLVVERSVRTAMWSSGAVIVSRLARCCARFFVLNFSY